MSSKDNENVVALKNVSEEFDEVLDKNKKSFALALGIFWAGIIILYILMG